MKASFISGLGKTLLTQYFRLYRNTDLEVFSGYMEFFGFFPCGGAEGKKWLPWREIW